MLFSQHDKLLFIGDSITDCGRARPVGEGFDSARLGAGYVGEAAALLGSVYPELSIRVVNTGVSGDQIRHLKARWQTDVLDLKPDWVSVLIGINDVWRQFDCPLQTEIHVPLDEYRQTYGELIEQTLPHVKGMILITPFYLEPNRKDPMRAMMDQYGQAVAELAGRYKQTFVDVQAAFDRLLEHYYPATIAWDRVHPNQMGSMHLARAILAATGFDR